MRHAVPRWEGNIRGAGGGGAHANGFAFIESVFQRADI